MSIDFREERITDHDAIRNVHVVSFPTAAESSIIDALRSADKLTISLVACDNDTVVGHVAFSAVTVDETAVGLGLGPVAVVPEYRRRGIADKLIRTGLKKCGTLGYGFIVVLGDPAYYCRFGFKAASSWGLVDEFGGGSAFQAIELSNGAIPDGGGTARYGQEFSIDDEYGAT